MYMLHCVSLFVTVISMCFVLFDAYCLLLTNPMLLCNRTEDNKSYHIIYHITILKFASLPSNCAVLIVHLLYRWNWPQNKIQRCLTSFWIGNYFVCLVQPALWLLAPYIGLSLALLNIHVLPYCSCSSTSLNALH